MANVENIGGSVQGSPRRVDSTQPVIGQQPLEGSGGGHVIGSADRARPVQATPVMRPEVMRLPVQGPVEVHSKVEEPVAPLEAVSRLGRPIYSTPAERAVLETVVAANDDTLQPRVVSNEEFEALRRIVEYDPREGTLLYLPEEFTPHHARSVARAIDVDTHKYSRGRESVEKELDIAGVNRIHLGGYIRDRLEGLGKGRELARATADGLIYTGVELVTGQRDRTSADQLLPPKFSVPGEFAALDEEARTVALDRFFGYAAEARASGDPVKQKVVERVAKHFLGDVQPQVAVERALFQRGALRLLTQPQHWDEYNETARKHGWDEVPEVPLADVIEIMEIRDALDQARTQGVEALSAAELKATTHIKAVISNLFVKSQYNEGATLPLVTPSSTLRDHKIECTIATAIGNRALKALGIGHAAVIGSDHIATVLATSDGKVYLDDFNSYYTHDNAIPLNDTDLIDITGTFIPMNEVAAFANDPTKEGFMVEDLSANVKQQLGFDKDKPFRLVIAEPESGIISCTLSNLSQRYEYLKNKDEAVAAAKRSVSANSIIVEAYRSLATLYRFKGEYEAAVREGLETVALTPNDPEMQWGLAGDYSALGDSQNDPVAAQKFYEAALRHVEKATGLQPKEAKYWHTRAYITGKLGNYDAAIVCAEAAIALDPDQVSFRTRHIALHYQSERYDDTLRLVDEAFTTVDPADTDTTAVLHNMRVQIYYLQGRYDEALTEIIQASELNPEDTNYERNKGRVHAKLGNLDEAARVYTRLIEADTTDIYSHYELATVYFQQGKIAQAKSELAMSEGVEKFERTEKGKADLAEMKKKITEAPVETS